MFNLFYYLLTCIVLQNIILSLMAFYVLNVLGTKTNLIWRIPTKFTLRLFNLEISCKIVERFPLSLYNTEVLGHIATFIYHFFVGEVDRDRLLLEDFLYVFLYLSGKYYVSFLLSRDGIRH